MALVMTELTERHLGIPIFNVLREMEHAKTFTPPENSFASVDNDFDDDPTAISSSNDFFLEYLEKKYFFFVSADHGNGQ